MTFHQNNEASRAQHAAAQPGRSAWIAANAGTGKTRVLTQRVARLLLAGTRPERILCLTYTKAAATEMQNRLFGELGRWAMLTNDDLSGALREFGAEISDPDILARARRLFAAALETPGGLKIQTIHAFCDRLLRQFPKEAGITPFFAELDDRQAKQIQLQILDAMAAREEPSLRALARIITSASYASHIKNILEHRRDLQQPFDEEKCRKLLGLEGAGSFEPALARLLAAPRRAHLAQYEALFLAGGKTSAQYYPKMMAAFALPSPAQQLTQLKQILIPNAALRQHFVVKKMEEAHPGTTDYFNDFALEIAALFDQMLAQNLLHNSAVFYQFAQRFLEYYRQEKQRRGLLDFDDLIDLSVQLLTQSEDREWVLYRLDGGIDHILVDEAQDTSPQQWALIDALSQEFYAGESSHDHAARTLFVVGDEKQSIYSFQGARPDAFRDMRAHLALQAAAADIPFYDGELLHSFRSSPLILKLVDQIFTGDLADGLHGPIHHHAFRDALPGRVDLWPYLTQEKSAAHAPWYEVVAQTSDEEGATQLAKKLAIHIQTIIADKTLLPGAGRAVRADDFLILVRSRGPLYHALIRALKQVGVPIAGQDRMKITENLAVRDLLSLLRFAATHSDDLALAEILRSPLGGLSEEALFDLAHGREGTLWQALRAQRDAFPAPVALCEDMIGRANYDRPFELLERALTHHHGRRNLLARLGAEVEESIDELLLQAQHYEQLEPPTLTGFNEWIAQEEIEVKRELSHASGELRIMTIHGAKGLEAPIIVLPDTAQRRPPSQVPLLRLEEQLFYPARKEERPTALQPAHSAHQQAEAHEQNRLLYVALTRACNWLIVAGAGAPLKEGGKSWYQNIAAGFDALGDRPIILQDDIRSISFNWNETTPATSQTAAAPLPRIADPDAPPRPQPARRHLVPSNLGGAHGLAGEAEEGVDQQAYGRLTHALLQYIPATRPEQHTHLIARLFAQEPSLDHAIQQRALKEAHSVLGDPALAPLFTASALVEQSLSGHIPGISLPFFGVIDRLILSDPIRAVDFKTNRLTPSSPSQIPEGILRQQAVYRELLRQIYPSRPLEMALVWTATRQYMPLDDEILTEALGIADGSQF